MLFIFVADKLRTALRLQCQVDQLDRPSLCCRSRDSTELPTGKARACIGRYRGIQCQDVVGQLFSHRQALRRRKVRMVKAATIQFSEFLLIPANELPHDGQAGLHVLFIL